MMFRKISGILSGTPAWVFFVFAYLVFIGIRATKDRTVHIGKMFLMPSIVLCTVFGQVDYNLEIGHLRDIFRSFNRQFAYLSFFRKT
jgi:hypothetical protein